MSKYRSEKRSLTFAAVFALVAGLFGATPAQAAPSTEAFYVFPAGADTSSFVTLVNEDFTLISTQVSGLVSDADLAYLKYSITTTRNNTNTSFSMTVRTDSDANTNVQRSTTSDTITGQTIFYDGQQHANNQLIPATVTSNEGGTEAATAAYVVVPAAGSNWSTESKKLSFAFHGGVTSASPSITVTVTTFIDTNQNNKFDSVSEVSKTVTVTFASWASVAPTVSLTSLEEGDTHITASAALSGLNFSQLSGNWFIKFTRNGLSVSAYANSTSFSEAAEITLTSAEAAAGKLSASVTIPAVTAGSSYSAQVGYVESGNVLGTDGQTSNVDLKMWGLSTTTLAAAQATAQTLYTVTGTNALANGDMRANAVVTVRMSVSQSSTDASVPVVFTFGGQTLTAAKSLSVNGGTPDTAGTHSAVTVNSTTKGIAEITLLTSGFAAGETVIVYAKVPGLAQTSTTLTARDLDWTVAAAPTYSATAPGTAVTVGVTVKDQFGQPSALTTQRVKFAWTAGYGGTATTSYGTVANGAASATVTPSPATLTGSGTVTATLQNYSATSNLWTDSSGDSIDLTVFMTSAANSFRTGYALSYSASISYGAAFSWSSLINDAYVLVTGSQVVVSGAGLMFKDVLGNTASDTITLPGDSAGQVQFYVTGRKAGSFPITITAGAASTTSEIVVSPARSDDGASIIWDTDSITAGRTKIVTGTLVDANGNPVYTDGPSAEANGQFTTASIAVSFAGTAGIPVGTMPTETDANGQFKVSILTTTADTGTFTLTTVYSAQGAQTSAPNKVTTVKSISVGESSTAVESDQKLTVGSFKGYVAIYAKGYAGSKLSAKVAGKWLVKEDLSSFERVVRLTGAGYTINVDLYIDSVFVRTDVITTK